MELIKRDGLFPRVRMWDTTKDEDCTIEDLCRFIMNCANCLKGDYGRPTLSLSSMAEWKLIAHFYDLRGDEVEAESATV